MQLNNSRPLTPRVSTLETVMPGWNGNESIMGYVIRKHREREEAARLRARRVWLFACLILWPAAGLVGIYAGGALAAYLATP